MLEAERRTSGLYTPAVVNKLNRDFLSKELAFGTAETEAVARRYNVTSYPSYLYFNPDGSLLYRRFGQTADAAQYLKDVAAAKEAQQDPQNLSHLAAEFRRGNRDVEFLKQYLLKVRALRLPTEQAVLDAYAQQLPARVFYQPTEVLFVLESGPVVGSPAFQLSHLSQKLIDSLYRVLPLPQRMAINSLIINNTMAQAAATKNRSLAEKGASFTRGTWNSDYAKGVRISERDMLNFYRNAKDSTSYLRQAVIYYERYYLNLPADSVKKTLEALQASRQRQAAFLSRPNFAARQRAARQRPTVAATTGQPVVTAGAVYMSRNNAPASFLQELNNGAWAIYQTGTRNKNYLSHALTWSKRTVDLDPAAYNNDTLAHLLYRLGFYAEAEAREQQAVALAHQEKTATAPYQQTLEKMRKRSL
ncbi:MAG: hypothetical protein EOO63_05155 [Hymenobacter sp.]|nr:MAG: hypothetical protein EOO63_05155 [Hymenobacter sp.]